MFYKRINFHFVLMLALLGVLVVTSANPLSADTPQGTPSAALAASPVSATGTLTATVTSTATRPVATATAISPTSTRVATVAPTLISPTATRIPPTAVPPTATRIPPTPTRASIQSPVVLPPSGRAPAGPAGTALQFNGSNQYVTFGSAAGLGVTSFTLETWIARTGPGTTVSTGTGGVVAVPLITKGRCQSDGSNVDANYFLGINASNQLAADFEDMNTGLNHPITGSGLIPTDGSWHHVAVTYDQPTGIWNLFLDGNLDQTKSIVGTDPVRSPRFDSIQHAALGTALDSNGLPTATCATTGGFFQGVMDEARIWNRALPLSEIQANRYSELTSGSGLIARWGLNEGSGATINSSVGTFPGTLTNGPTWVAGFPSPDTTPPAAPSGLAAAPYSSATALTWTANSEPDMAGYNLYRATTTGGPYTRVNASLITTTAYTDSGLTNGTTYYYVLRAVDTSTNESGNSSEISATPQSSLGAALQFDGVNDYVTFGTAPQLGATTFTIETWFKRTGTGVAVSTGSNGVMAVPLVTKGSPEADGSSVDENYILGIRSSDNVLAGDFETFAACAGRPAGDNTPIVGVTPIVNNTWYHAAFTYDGTALRLYLNGNLESTLASTCIPRYDSIQHAGLGTYLTSTGATSGFFAGVLDEVRIWNVAHTQWEIQSTINSELTSGKSLIGRWGMNEGTGTTINSSIGTTTGTLTNGPVWVPGAPFNISFTPPAAPGGLNATSSSAYRVDLTWVDNSTNEANFEIERGSNSGGPFSPLASVGANTTTYADTNVTSSTQYCYRVRATNAGGSSAYATASCATTPAQAAYALQFGSANAYVKFANSASLNSPAFTVETWFRRDGAGTGTTTGTGGVASAIPLITKGTAEAETAPADINYFLGIDTATNTVCADFEEAQTGATPSLNHPVWGTTAIANGVWYHVAATYDGSQWVLYLNGTVEATLTVGQPANAANISPAALGTSIRSDGATALGYFNGVLDEARIWNVARTPSQIQSTVNSELTTPQTGLIARWGLNEGSGAIVNGSAGTTVNGSVIGSGYSWITPGAPFVINLAPNVPAVNNPSNGATGVPTATPLTVTVADPESNPMTVRFYGRLKTNSPQFSLVLLPDTQYYTTVGNQPTGAAIFNGQTNWIVNNKTSRNIAFVNNLGDITDQIDAASFDSEWTIADAAFDLLDAGNVPYNVLPGNHDLNTGAARFETWFGVSRFSGKSYYGGHYGTDNTNNYNLFSASGLDFILINLSCPAAAPPAAVLDWANTLLAANSNRRGIAVCHDLLGAGATPGFSTAGQAVYTALKGNPNLFLLLGGHLVQAGFRTDTFNGNTVYSMRSDYQYEPNGGNGWLRILEFQPANNRIQVWTYSPYLSQSLTDATNQFAVAYDMSGPWQLIGTVNSVASGSTASVNWTGLGYTTQYEWYATANDGLNTTTSPTWSFTTENVPTAVTLSSFTVLAMGSANNWLTPYGLVLGILAMSIGGMWLMRNR